MIGITLICIGKLKEQYLKDACEEYAKRMRTAYKLEIHEIAPYRLPDAASGAQILAALEQEGVRIAEKIPKGAYVISLCIEGGLMDSRSLSEKIEKTAAGTAGSLAFIIGGSHGLSESVKKRSDLLLSMSPMTFPHQLARVMLLEQLYRAAQIRLGTKYHK